MTGQFYILDIFHINCTVVFYNSTIKCYSVISCDNIHEQKGSTMYMFDWLSVVRLLILAVFTFIFGERSGSDLTGEHRISSLSHCGRCHCVVSLSNIIHCQVLVQPTETRPTWLKKCWLWCKESRQTKASYLLFCSYSLVFFYFLKVCSAHLGHTHMQVV